MRILLICIILIYSNHLLAVENDQAPSLSSSIFKAAKNHWLTIYPGVSVKSALIEITRKSDSQEANLSNDPGVLALEFNLKLKDFDFPGTNWGFTMFAYSSYFKVDEQYAGVDGAEPQGVDLGTSITGQYAYAVPAIYYRKDRKSASEAEIQYGFGIGYGSAKFEGTAIFGPDKMVNSSDPKTNIKSSALDVLAYTVFYNLAWQNRINLRISVTTLSFEDDAFEFGFSEATLLLTRSFSFF